MARMSQNEEYARERERQADDVGFARTPVPVEDGGGPLGVNVARPVGFDAGYHASLDEAYPLND